MLHNDHRNVPVLAARGISVSYGDVRALTDVDLALQAGHVTALLGENGAGKSTLMRALAGGVIPAAGTIVVDGKPVSFRYPRDATALGIRMIQQELQLVPFLSVAENICLGNESTRYGIVDSRILKDRARVALAQIGQTLPLDALVATLSTASRQIVEIAKAIATRVRVLIMDEPTASLSEQECTALFAMIDSLTQSGVAIVYCTHRLDEIDRLADSVVVLRDGRVVARSVTGAMTRDQLISAMVGRTLAHGYPPPGHPPGAVILHTTSLSAGLARDVTLTVRAGEIVGLVGLIGAGRTDVAKAIVGALPVRSGAIELGGVPFHPTAPSDSVQNGVAFIPEDRKHEGLVLQASVNNNIALATLRDMVNRGIVDRKKEAIMTQRWVDAFRIKTPTRDTSSRASLWGESTKSGFRPRAQYSSTTPHRR